MQKRFFRYGESLSIESLVVAFTDLKISSKIYEKLSDARAFDLVMKHFDTLRKNIDEYGCKIFKTKDYAVMQFLEIHREIYILL